MVTTNGNIYHCAINENLFKKYILKSFKKTIFIMKMKANRFDSSFFAAWERILSITTEIWYPILLTQTYLLNTLLLNDSYVLF